MTIIGIDPGLQGAVAVVSTENAVAHVLDTPVVSFTKNKKVRTGYDVPGMARLLTLFRGARNDMMIYLEQVNAHPENAVRAAFLMGRGVGTWEGVIGALHLPLQYVTPVVWKRHHALLGTDKQAARLKAQQLFPSADLRRKKDVGRADALLIAAWGKAQQR